MTAFIYHQRIITTQRAFPLPTTQVPKYYARETGFFFYFSFPYFFLLPQHFRWSAAHYQRLKYYKINRNTTGHITQRIYYGTTLVALATAAKPLTNIVIIRCLNISRGTIRPRPLVFQNSLSRFYTPRFHFFGPSLIC